MKSITGWNNDLLKDTKMADWLVNRCTGKCSGFIFADKTIHTLFQQFIRGKTHPVAGVCRKRIYINL